MYKGTEIDFGFIIVFIIHYINLFIQEKKHCVSSDIYIEYFSWV